MQRWLVELASLSDFVPGDVAQMRRSIRPRVSFVATVGLLAVASPVSLVGNVLSVACHYGTEQRGSRRTKNASSRLALGLFQLCWDWTESCPFYPRPIFANRSTSHPSRATN